MSLRATPALMLAALLAAAVARADVPDDTPAPPPPSIVALDAAPVRVSPNGKARITLLARGEQAFVGRLEIEPGAVLPEHRDPTEEYVHVLAGTGVVTIDGKQTAVGPGMTIFMPAGAAVSYRNGPEKAVVLQVFADPAPADRYAKWRSLEAAAGR